MPCFDILPQLVFRDGGAARPSCREASTTASPEEEVDRASYKGRRSYKWRALGREQRGKMKGVRMIGRACAADVGASLRLAELEGRPVVLLNMPERELLEGLRVFLPEITSRVRSAFESSASDRPRALTTWK